MIEKKEWKEFKDSGILWFINMILHTFGWAIIFDIDNDGNVINVYPSRVKFRGFDEKSNTDGYIKISEFMDKNSNDLLKEARE